MVADNNTGAIRFLQVFQPIEGEHHPHFFQQFQYIETIEGPRLIGIEATLSLNTGPKYNPPKFAVKDKRWRNP